MDEEFVNRERVLQDLNALANEYQDIKQRIAADIESLVKLLKAKSDTINVFQKEVQDARWFLGEEHARRDFMEKELQHKALYIQQLENDLQKLRTCLGESQWYLGEERSKREQLEYELSGCQNRCQELGAQLKCLRGQG
jgi:phenylpyruvate tautomerase PptA (4-oxalocrotonate tautomerase family)